MEGDFAMNVYDFDNTIYKGESCVDFFLYYLKRNPKLIAALPWVIKCIVKYKARKITLQDALDNYAGVVESYAAKIGNVKEDVSKFWDINEAKIKPFYLQQRRDDDIIVSACFDVVLEEICKRLDIRNFVGTETDLEKMKIVNLCYRENKVKVFKEKYPDAVIDNFYTDSLNDQPMIDLAKNAYLVKGNKITKIK